MNWSNFGARRVTAGRDYRWDAFDFIAEWLNLQVPPALAQNHKQRGRNVIDERTTSTLQNPFQIYDRLE
jgi:hypothetical protein